MAMDKTEAYLRVLDDSVKNKLVKMEFGSNTSFYQLNAVQKARLGIIVRNYAASGDCTTMSEAVNMFKDPVSAVGIVSTFNTRLSRICALPSIYKSHVNRLDLQSASNSNGTKLENLLTDEKVIYRFVQEMDDGSSFLTLSETTVEEEQSDQDDATGDRNKLPVQPNQEKRVDYSLSGFNSNTPLIASPLIYSEQCRSFYPTGGRLGSQNEAFLRQSSSLIVQSMSVVNHCSDFGDFIYNDQTQLDHASLVDVSSKYRIF